MNIKNVRSKFKIAIITVPLSIIATGVAYSYGGGSTGGGSLFAYQAEGLKVILSSAELVNKLAITDYAKSIQHLGWSQGAAHYKITTNNGCEINADAVLESPTTMSYRAEIKSFECN